MQEEVEHKTVNFAISTTKLTARTFLKGAQFLLRQYDKNASQGKQSMKCLIRQNRGVTNVEIEKTGIKGFAKYAKRYHIDYAVQKDISCTPPRYMVYFKAQDTDALSAAFKEYSASVLNKTKRPSVLAKLQELVQAAQAATNTIPVLGTSVTEYGVALGLDNFSGTVGGNVSGTSDLAPLDQQADMIVEWMPDAKKVGLLYCSAEANSQYQVDEVQK